MARQSPGAYGMKREKASLNYASSIVLEDLCVEKIVRDIGKKSVHLPCRIFSAVPNQDSSKFAFTIISSQGTCCCLLDLQMNKKRRNEKRKNLAGFELPLRCKRHSMIQ
jgi:hypothetical protein